MKINRVFKLLSQLSDIKRYSTNYLVKQESVLEHTAGVCILVYWMLIELEKRTGIKLDAGSVLSKAVLHDFEEAVTGDIPRTTKYCSDEVYQGLKKYELISMGELLKNFDLGQETYELWLHAKEGPEGMLIKAADILCVAYKLHNEIVVLNNFSVLPVIEEAYLNLERIINELNDLEKDLSHGIQELQIKFIKTVLFDGLDIMQSAINYKRRK